MMFLSLSMIVLTKLSTSIQANLKTHVNLYVLPNAIDSDDYLVTFIKSGRSRATKV